eukprot:TRINITY_DN214_c0_g1_i1.p1 TRINITY_DN214_c0_g1~~TRINITY_DN214_c0_g1_i1.p1  ORF type:complete len:353 (+),score=86.43 TRINITY_DN214_c0_g1_i1:66-1124(+)
MANESYDSVFEAILKEIESLSSDLPRYLCIRVEKWAKKLAFKTHGPEYKRNRNKYAALLLKQARTRSFSSPYDKLPPEGHLPMLPTHLALSISKSPSLRKPIRSEFWENLYETMKDGEDTKNIDYDDDDDDDDDEYHSTTVRPKSSMKKSKRASLKGSSSPRKNKKSGLYGKREGLDGTGVHTLNRELKRQIKEVQRELEISTQASKSLVKQYEIERTERTRAQEKVRESEMLIAVQKEKIRVLQQQLETQAEVNQKLQETQQSEIESLKQRIFRLQSASTVANGRPIHSSISSSTSNTNQVGSFHVPSSSTAPLTDDVLYNPVHCDILPKADEDFLSYLDKYQQQVTRLTV